MNRKPSRRVTIKNINFKANEAIKAETEREIKRRKDMDGRLTTFLVDCMRQFVIQSRNPDSVPVYPLEFVTKPSASGEPAPPTPAGRRRGRAK